MAQLVHAYGRELAKSMFDLLNTRMYGRSPSAEMAEIVQKELGNQRKREIREQNSYGLDTVRDGISLGKDKVNNPIVDYEQIMRLPNLNFYVRLPGEYPVVRLGLKYKKLVKRNAGLIERNIRDVLSPELEKVIQENERAATAAGLNFPTGDEVLENSNVATDTVPAVAPKPVQVKAESKPARTEVAKAEATASAKPLSVIPVSETAPEPETAPDQSNISDNVIVLKPLNVHKNPNLPEREITASAVSRQPVTTHEAAGQDDLSSVTPALAVLRKFRQQAAGAASNEGDEDVSGGGESMSLDMHVSELADGGLELSTAGTHEPGDDHPADHRASKSLAQDEENILLHRHPDDPGYSEYDLNYDDGERDL